MNSNPQQLIELALSMVKARYAEDSSQAPPMIFACRDNEVHSVLELNFDDQYAKDMSIMAAAMFLRTNNCDASIHISEAWMSHQTTEQFNSGSYTPPSQSPDRVEVMICEVSSPDQYLNVIQRMNRGESGDIISFTELHRVDSLNPAKEQVTAESRFDFFGGLKRKLDS